MTTTHTPLPYRTLAALIAAFAAGVKFEVAVLGTAGRPVDKIEPLGPNAIRVFAKGDSSSWNHFRPDGSNNFSSARLVLSSALPEVQRTPDFSVERLGAGEKFVNPKTGEEVDSLGASRDGVEVVFVGGRTSSNYRANGTHRHDPARDLAPLPKVKTMRIEIAQSHDGTFRAVVNVAHTFSRKRGVGDIVGLGQRVVHVNEFDLPA